MTIGIYKLVFNGTDKVYIGQSINIEARFEVHKHNMIYEKASKKLNSAYSSYGLPSLHIEEELPSIDSLDNKELYYINKYNSIENGFNTVLFNTPPALYGENSAQSIYDKAGYIRALEVLVYNPYDTIASLADKFNISKHVLADINKLNTHTWLAMEEPELYDKLKELSLLDSRAAHYKRNGIPKLVNPYGEVFEVSNVSTFSALHSVNYQGIGRVLRGTQKAYKGWHLLGTEATKPIYCKLIDSKGTIITIYVGEATSVAKKLGITGPSLSLLKTGKSKSVKGWRLYTI